MLRNSKPPSHLTMDNPDLYNPFNGNGECDMAPKERKKVGFTPDTAPPVPDPALEYDYPTARLRRNSVSERDLARQLSMAIGQTYASKPRPSIHKPAESTPPDVELGGAEACPTANKTARSTELRSTHTSELQN